METIEKLTPEERAALQDIADGAVNSYDGVPEETEAVAEKALRIIGQQAVEIVRLSEDLAQLRERVSKALAALAATRFNPSGSFVEWALSSEGRNLGYVMVALTALRGQGTPHVQTQAAPTPDYRSEVERCSCEEALALREELGAASRELKQLADRVDNAEQRVAEQRERIRQDCIAAEERAAEVAALRAERQERESTVLDYAKECADLRAEVERLRAELTELNGELARMQRERNDAIARGERFRAKHEECNDCELVGSLRAEVSRLQAAVPFSGDPDRVATLARKLAAANALVSEVLDTPSVTLVDWVAWGKRARAHLAGQAPAQLELEKRFERAFLLLQRVSSNGLVWIDKANAEIVERAVNAFVRDELARRDRTGYRPTKEATSFALDAFTPKRPEAAK